MLPPFSTEVVRLGRRYSREELERTLGVMGGRWLQILETQAILKGCYTGCIELESGWSYSRVVRVYMQNGRLEAIETLSP